MSPGPVGPSPDRAGQGRRWPQLSPALRPPATTQEKRAPGDEPGAVTDLPRRSAVETVQQQTDGRHSIDGIKGRSIDVPAYLMIQAEVAIQVERRRLCYHGRHRQEDSAS